MTVKISNVGPCSYLTLMVKAKEAGFQAITQDEEGKHPVRYRCPTCYGKALANAKIGAQARGTVVRMGAVRVAGLKAFAFTHPDGRQMAACHHCGYRKMVAPDGPTTPANQPTNPVDAATAGMKQGVETLRCKAITGKGERCRNMAGTDGYCYLKDHNSACPHGTVGNGY